MENRIKNYLKKRLTRSQKENLKNIYVRVMSKLFARNLNRLATLHATDKWNAHWYTQRYAYHLKEIRLKKLNILEIGVGGYTNPNYGGQSLRMWKYYFPNSKIFSIDIYDKSALQEKRIKIFKGSQDDKLFLEKIYGEIGNLDIIIDDGSHMNKHIIDSFETLFPLLNIGGFYIIEDLFSSYWPDFGGDSSNLSNPATAMNFIKNLTDCLNYEEFLMPGYIPSFYDKHIISIHFYHNLVFIKKGYNNEGSKDVKNNQRLW